MSLRTIVFRSVLLIAVPLLVAPIAGAAPRIPPPPNPAVTIDGHVQPGEWNGATAADITLQLPDGTAVPATIYMTNDANNLYAALTFATKAADTISVSFNFDVNDDDVIDDGDDACVGILSTAGASSFVDDYYFEQGICPVDSICSGSDTDRGGTTDGTAVGTRENGVTTIELMHPLRSADVANDIQIADLGKVGFRMVAVLVSADPANPGGYAQTAWPPSEMYQYFLH